jgi:hypothetical protein
MEHNHCRRTWFSFSGHIGTSHLTTYLREQNDMNWTAPHLSMWRRLMMMSHAGGGLKEEILKLAERY